MPGRTLRIAVLSDVEATGGANIAAGRLTDGFVAAGHQVTRIYQTAASGDPRVETRLIRSLVVTHDRSVVERAAWRFVPARIRQRLHERSSEAQLDRILSQVRADVINIHNLHIGRWSPEMIRVAAAHAPVVCKLCDTWTFTGRCYNPGDCTKFLSHCDATCPTPHEYPALEPGRIRQAFELRRAIFEQCTNVAAIAPSRWIGRLAADGVWRPRSVFHVPNGIDLERFAPIDRLAARRALGLEVDGAPVMLCVASQLAERKKGLPMLIEALAAGLPTPIHLLLLGAPVELPALANVAVHQLGYVSDDRGKALAYNSADIYVHPSLADNSPNTVIESLASGTPVVGFALDGVPEMVVPGKTGWLAENVSSMGLRDTLMLALRDVDRGLNLRTTTRRFAEGKYRLPDVITQYESVFRHMITKEPTDVPMIAANDAQTGQLIGGRL